MIQNIRFPKFLDPESIRKKGETKLCSLKAVDYYNCNNNFLG